jgi:hypothetical protein
MTPEQAPETPATPAPVAATPAPRLNAVQILEQELFAFIKQREQAVANLHAIEGAIQATQQLLGKVRAEVAKAVSFVETEASKVEAAVEKVL